MKKSLIMVLALVFVLGIATTAFAAANPFDDVPAHHWAYSAVAKLAADGIIDGYGDGTFRGDKVMTRYEMASMVGRAISRSDRANAEDKALISKLSAEFADELNSLGVRVSKLEANASNIKLGGDARLRYINKQNAGSSNFTERVRIYGNAQVTDNISFYFRDALVKDEELGSYYDTTSGSTYGSTSTKNNVITDVYANFKDLLPGVSFKAGRYSLNLGQTTYLAGSTGGFDGVEGLWTGGKSSLQFGFADASTVNNIDFNKPSTFANVAHMYYAQYNYKPDNTLNFDLNYVKSQSNNGVASGSDLIDITGAGVTWKFAPDWAFVSDYWQNSGATAKAANNGSTPKAIVARLAYKGSNPAVPGSWGFAAEYNKNEIDTIDGNWSGAMTPVGSDVKFYDVQYSNALAKNLIFNAIYAWDLTTVSSGKAKDNNFTRLELNFLF
ncbi:Hypothetical protein LUCI_3627 [Lucifera butyrica]|uniref:SLH domain-containing protein n=1 Tax=Lucifera butyrica TaxID=1351585 RepID=A0A498RBL3_9FIRM|nr:S-layer homology domain-containing protein [Lucifera butyrica]VBB08355.1 Hypothetical protein LUCI_3627 [Lucifera butyrica]